MAYDYNFVTVDKLISADTSNNFKPNETQMGNGILLNSNLASNVNNALMYKLSAAAKHNQNFGCSQYIPGKKYPQGSIVLCNILKNGVNTLIPMIAKRDDVTSAPLQGITKQENGSIYFTSFDVNNTDDWQAIELGNSRVDRVTFPDFNCSGYSNDNQQFKFVRLLDLSNARGVNECQFTLTIKRNDITLFSRILVRSIGSSTIELYVKDVICSLYDLDGGGSAIFNNSSPFKDIALNGCLLSVNQDKKIYLVVVGRKSSAWANVEIKTKLESGSIAPSLVNLNSNLGYTFFNNNSNIIVPFRAGSSNTFCNVGMIYSFFEEINFKSCFLNGLIPLTNSGTTTTTINQFLYPGLQKITGSNNIYATDGRVLTQDSSARYIEAQAPNIKFGWDDAWCKSFANERNVNGAEDWPNGLQKVSRFQNYKNLVNMTLTGWKYPNGSLYNFMIGGAWEDSSSIGSPRRHIFATNTMSFNAHDSISSVYTDGASTIKTAGVKVYRYLKVM